MEIKRNCINVCSISGPKNNIELIDERLNYDFSMNSFYPLSLRNDNVERLMSWGCEEDMELLTYISCRFVNPQSIDMAYATDIPNLLFLRKISQHFSLTIEHSFCDSVAGYIGYNKIVNGELIEFDYEEDTESAKYKELKKKYNFYTEEEWEQMQDKPQKIISMQDILKYKK